MATFVMIHGAWHGGWSFDLLRPLLEAQGHRMVAPTLPGMDGGDATLNGWADFVADLVRAESGPVILCGHSRGGIVISEAAERNPEAVSVLIYIAAFLLPSGRSFVEEVNSHPRNSTFQDAVSLTPDGKALLIDSAIAQEIFYNRTRLELASSAANRLVAEPLAPALSALSLSAARYGGVPRVYIECTDDRAVPLGHQKAMHEREGCCEVIEIDSDHSPFLSVPERLTDILCDIAAAHGLRN